MDSIENRKICRTRWKERRRIKKRVAAALLQIRQPTTINQSSPKNHHNILSNNQQFVQKVDALSSVDSPNSLVSENQDLCSDDRTIDLGLELPEVSHLSKPDM